MVLPFELYCKDCGSKIIDFIAQPDISELLPVLQEEKNIDSWLSRKLRGRLGKCPDCGRQLQVDPLIRAEVMFGGWADNAESSKHIIFYV
jgi:hypothetical protein